MDRDIMLALDRFDSVWQRVTGVSPEESPTVSFPPEDDAACLARFLEDSCRSAAVLAALLRRNPPCSPRLRRLHAREREQLCRLQTEYFLLTGKRFAPPRFCPAPGDFLGALRQLWLEAQARADTYRNAADGSSPLCGLYRTLAQQQREQAASLRELISRQLC